jgi:phage-related protein (TIGR01555 family)
LGVLFIILEGGCEVRKTKRYQKQKQYAKDNKAEKKRTVSMDSFSNPLARLGYDTPNLLEGTEYPITRLTQNYTLLNSLYRSHWIARKIIDCIPEDMMKNWIELQTQLEPDEIKRFDKLLRTTRVQRDILQGLKLGRLYGGAGAVIIIEGQENMLDQPLDYDTIMPGSFKGLIVGDRWIGLTPMSEIITDVTNPDFGLPEYYSWVTDDFTVRVHHSRVLRFTGRELPPIERYTEMQWGSSEIEVVFDELKKRDNTSWNIAQLVFNANIRVMKMSDWGEMLAVGDENLQRDIYATITKQNILLSNMGMLLMNKEDEFQNYQYSFSGINDIYESFMLDVAGAAEMPVTKLFGRAPAGMNATGESDMQNYYNTVEQKQIALLEPVLDKLLPIMFVSEFGAIPDDLDYTFNPIETPNDDDLANVVDKKANTIINAFNAGLISQKVGMKELRQMADGTGMFTNITDEDIDNADSDISNDIGDMPPSNNRFIPYGNNDSIYSMDTDPDTLQTEIESEKTAIDQYKADIKKSEQQGDSEAVTYLTEILKDEEDHLKMLNTLKKKRGW